MCDPVTLAALGTAASAGAATGTAATVLGAVMAGSTALSAYGAYQGASAQKVAAKSQAKMAENNAVMAGWQAEDALARGDAAVAQQTRQNDALQGRQRASLAANGVDLSSGSAANLLEDAQVFGQMDIDNIRNNAMRSAWGFRASQQNDFASASMARAQASQINPALSAATSLLGSASQLSSSWLKGGKGAGGGGVMLMDDTRGMGRGTGAYNA